MRAYERFLNYVQYDTASNENSPTCPSTEKQLVLARALVEELKALGVEDARMDEHGYVYGSVPANAEGLPSIGLISHMDVVDCVPSAPVIPAIIRDYDGGPVTLANGMVLDPAVFPEVAGAKSKSLIVTDGNTSLGADDKAGVAEIMTLVERLQSDPALKHGRICVGFTPDEEIGRGADLFDVKGFGAEFAYTVDGGAVGGISYECFNAASGLVTVHGRNVHPGSAKNIMVNASLVAMEFAGMLPPQQRPEHTEGYEGFFHLSEMKGQEELATLHYIIRDHDRVRFEARKEQFQNIAAYLNGKYGPGAVEVEVKDSYYNMRELIEERMDIVERANAAYRAVGVEPWSEPIRGGTDGARLTFMGLPCPNIATGGMNCHGRFECVAIEDMDLMTDMLVHLVTSPRY
ncbi:MAG: peptidase T [Clostridia bacterium]|nr:peptidase T [Clostridia bacterium]